jgi:hypothetical protein
MARLKDVNFSLSGEDVSRETRKIEESVDAGNRMIDQAATESYRIFKLSDTTKKGKYHMECTDDVWDESEKKMIRIRLLRGVDTIYQRDQKGLEPAYVSSNRRTLIFDNRVLRVPSYDTVALEFLEKSNANVDNPHKRGTRKLTFFEWNPVRQAELERSKRVARIEAIKYASMQSDEDMKKHATYLGIPFFDELSIPKTTEALRNDYEFYAEAQPAKFMQSAGSKEVEVAYIVKNAIISGKIDLGIKPGSAYWASDGGFICKIPPGTPPNSYLVDFALMPNDDSVNFLNQLKKMQ